MDQETCHRIKRNDPELTELWLGHHGVSLCRNIGMHVPDNNADLAGLGDSIGNNTHLIKICFYQQVGDNLDLGGAMRVFGNGIKRNTTICKLRLSRCNLSEGTGFELLKAFGENASNLEEVCLAHCDLGSRGHNALANTLGKCTGLRQILLPFSNINDELLEKIIVAIRGHTQLEILDLSSNNIRTDGCTALANLMQNPKTRLRVLALDRNDIEDSGAVVVANSLRGNTKLEELHLDGNPRITQAGLSAFFRVLCNTSSVNDTYLSNHTLHRIEEFDSEDWVPDELRHVLDRNCSYDKNEVAIEKILHHHQNFDMEPLFKWDLKVLPFALEWLYKARASNGNNDPSIDAKVLSAIYQFTLAMPIHFVPASIKPRGSSKNCTKMNKQCCH